MAREFRGRFDSSMNTGEAVVTVSQISLYVLRLVMATSIVLMLVAGGTATFLPKAGTVYVLLAAWEAHVRRLLFDWRVVVGFVVLAAVGTAITGRWDMPAVPAPGSEAMYWANILGALGVFTILNTSFVHYSGWGQLGRGFPVEEPLKSVNRRVVFRWFLSMFGITIVAGAAARNCPGFQHVIGAGCALAMSLYCLLAFLRATAFLRRGYAPWASEDAPRLDNTPVFLALLSDVHVTGGGRRRTDGGPSGGGSLERHASSLATSDAAVVVVCGDLVDTGEEDEWAVAMKHLRPLKKPGRLVLVAPGNHDLATAYTASSAKYFLRFTTNSVRIGDPWRLIRYFEYAAELEPRLLSASGRALADLVVGEKRMVAALESTWQKAAEEAGNELRRRGLGVTGGPAALKVLRMMDAEACARLMAVLIDEAANVLLSPDLTQDELARAELTQALVASPECRFPPEALFLRWHRLWADAFPLSLRLGDSAVEYLILNSACPEPGLAGSAYGELGEEQMNRVEAAVRATRASTLVIIMHHSLFRWRGQRQDETYSLGISLDRWALLGHNTVESRTLAKLLESAPPATCRRVILCTGHRHAPSSAGPWNGFEEEDAPDKPRLWVMESASLPDLDPQNGGPVPNEDLLVCVKDASGVLEPRRIPFSQFVQRPAE